MNKQIEELRASMRRTARAAYVADLRAGRKFRATTIPNKKRIASRNACRSYKGGE